MLENERGWCIYFLLFLVEVEDGKEKNDIEEKKKNRKRERERV